MEKLRSFIATRVLTSVKYTGINDEKTWAFEHLVQHLVPISFLLVSTLLTVMFFDVDDNFYKYRGLMMGIYVYILVMHTIDFLLHNTKTDPVNFASWNIFKNSHHYETSNLIIGLVLEILSTLNIKPKFGLHLSKSTFLMNNHFNCFTLYGFALKLFDSHYVRQWYTNNIIGIIQFVFLEMGYLLHCDTIDTLSFGSVLYQYLCYLVYASMQLKHNSELPAAE